MTKQEMKEWIDNSSFEQLLRRWRFAPAGEPIFQDEIGEYYIKVMGEKRAQDPEEAILASKRIGW